jgi:hypothetical protein
MQSIFSPPALFFALGVLAAVIKSDLKVPDAAGATMGLFLLTAIGVRAGVAVSETGLDGAVAAGAVAATLLGVLFAWTGYNLLTSRLFALDPANAGSVAGHFGAVSSMTLVLSVAFLEQVRKTYEPFVPALYPFMDTAALVTAILLARRGMSNHRNGNGVSTGELLREGLTARTTVLLVGGLLVGFVTAGPQGMGRALPFFDTLFFGVASFFMLDIGLVAGARLSELKAVNKLVLGYAILMPLVHVLAAALTGTLIGLSPGGTMVFAIGLAGGASFISAPIVMRTALPQANPSLSLSLALAVAFPFNVLIGIPLAYQVSIFLAGVF